MTLILVWRDADDTGAWIVSDSRLSNPGTVGTKVISDRAAKVLAAPAILRRQTPQSVLGTPVCATSLGFAYSGSSLIALQAYSAVVPLWSHLQTSGNEVLPSVRQFADHLRFFVDAYAREVCATAPNSACQCVLVGWDASSPTASAYVVEAVGSIAGVATTCRQIPLPDTGHVEFLGSGRAEARERYEAYRELNPFNIRMRLPLSFIRYHLRSDHQGDVGGGVQVGHATPSGFQLYCDAQPIEYGRPAAIMRYRGFDIGDIGTVGDAFINMPGIG